MMTMWWYSSFTGYHEHAGCSVPLEAGMYIGGPADDSNLTCQADDGMFVTPGSRGHGPKSYRLQKECAASGDTNTKQSSVCLSESSS